MPDAPLAGHRALVVGASKGIGRVVARRLHAEGAHVACSARSKDSLDKLAAELGERGTAIACDVREPEECVDAVARAADELGGLDTLVYSAGVAEFTELASASAEQWRTVFETNVLGAVLVTGAAIPHLSQQNGRALYLGSETTLTNPWPGLGLYASSKAALDRCVMNWNAEVADVSFTVLHLGPTPGTEFATGKGADAVPFGEQWFRLGLITDGRLEPQDHADAVMAVLTNRARIDTMWVRPRR